MSELTDRFVSLARARVSRTIASSASRTPLVVLTAPQGYGKTIALRDFASEASASMLWITLGSAERTVAGFARTLLDAIPTQASRVSRSAVASEFVEPQAFGLLLGEEAIELPSTVILDDFGGSNSDPRIVALVEAAIVRTRGRCSWLIATRDSAALPISRWCATGLLDEPIDERDLRFDGRDADDIARAWGVSPANGFVETLLAATDGWPHAFALGLRARLQGDAESSALGETRARMHAFFADRVIAPSSPEERRFLLDTCVYEEITSEMLDAFGPGAAATMARVRAATSFVALGSDAAFRYHPVFRDFLRELLRSEGTAAYDAVMAGALRTLDAIGRHADGIRLAMRGAPALLAETLRFRGGSSIDRGEFALLRDALALLPPAVRESDPDIMNLIGHVGGDIPVDFEQSYEEMLARERAPSRHAYLALGLAARLERTGRAREAFGLLDRIDAALVEHEPTRARVLAEQAALLGRVLVTDEVTRRIGEALALADAAPDDVLGRAVVHWRAAAIALIDERYLDAVRHASLAVDSAARSGAPRIELRARAVLYRASLELARFDNARAHLSALRSRAADTDDLEMTLYALVAASDAAADAGDEAWFDELDPRLGRASSSGSETFVESLNARLGDALVRSRALRKAWDGHYSEALRDLDRVSLFVSTARSTAAEAAVYAAASGDVGRASGECARIRAGLENSRNAAARDAVLARLLVAVAAILVGDDATFLADVTALESMADRLSLQNICFLHALRAMHDYAGNRTSRMGLVEQTEAMAMQGLGGYARLLAQLPIRASLVTPTAILTATELKVLELLCDGLTSREIALRLERSVLTVDSHVKMIVKKLRCTGGRREAVTIARSGRVAGLIRRPNSLVG